MHMHTQTHTHTHTHQVGMLEEDVLVGQTKRKRGNNVERSQLDLQAAIRDTQLACLMASGISGAYIYMSSMYLP